jgi:hypothetical protein
VSMRVKRLLTLPRCGLRGLWMGLDVVETTPHPCA